MSRMPPAAGNKKTFWQTFLTQTATYATIKQTSGFSCVHINNTEDCEKIP
eukprot:m.15203 g.15203  ORF g.15203 m.15203 type:complete len:50 (-) comp10656_c0_seq2:94-243(-)